MGQFKSGRIKVLQILLHPLGRGHVVFLLEGGIEDGLALEAGALRDALNGDGQVSTFAQQGDGMSHTQFISISGDELWARG